MDRTMWTDERLDDRFDWIDRRFDEVDSRFDRLERRVDAGFTEVRAEFRDIRRLIFLLWGPTMVGILASIAVALVTNT
jgi:tetrahydromethanopterin S-methyltransferase subunit G